MSPPTPRPILEICVDTPRSLAAAIAGGADRIELCADLATGGLTPSPGLIALAREAPIPVYAMIRPRPGGFTYAPDEVHAMLADIAAVRNAGLAGVVLGATMSDRRLDRDILSTLSAAADGLGRTLHRAFDLVQDVEEAMAVALSLKFERILTSGQATNAVEGRAGLKRAVRLAGDRIAIMAGGGVTPGNLRDLLTETGVTEVHASAKREEPSDPAMAQWGFAASKVFGTDAEIVRALKTALRE